MIARLSKKHLDHAMRESELVGVLTALYDGGFWTSENLDTAYEELTEDGLLLKRPKPVEDITPVAEPATPVAATPAPAAPAAPAPAPAKPEDERIVRVVRQPRASLGIRSSEATAAPPAPASPELPPAEGLDSLSDAQIDELMRGTTRLAIQNRRKAR
jgi:hypothetical protein